MVSGELHQPWFHLSGLWHFMSCICAGKVTLGLRDPFPHWPCTSASRCRIPRTDIARISGIQEMVQLPACRNTHLSCRFLFPSSSGKSIPDDSGFACLTASCRSVPAMEPAECQTGRNAAATEPAQMHSPVGDRQESRQIQPENLIM